VGGKKKENETGLGGFFGLADGRTNALADQSAEKNRKGKKGKGGCWTILLCPEKKKEGNWRLLAAIARGKACEEEEKPKLSAAY